MQKGFFSKHKLLIIVLILLKVYFVYMLVLQPIVAWAWFPPIEHRGTELYTNGTYLRFEDGKAFRNAINSMPFIDGCEIKEFYYYNTFLRDNPFYGKMCDTYALDLYAGDNYGEITEYLISARHTYESYDNYVFHVMNDTNTRGNHVIIATNEQTCMVRYIMLTDMQPYDYPQYFSLLIKQSGLEWD